MVAFWLRGSNAGRGGRRLGIEELGHEQQLIAMLATAAQTEPAAHQVAVRASSGAQVASLAGRTFVDRLLQGPMSAWGRRGELGGQDGRQPSGAIGLLAAGVGAVDAATGGMEAGAADRALPIGSAERLYTVTHIVTDGSSTRSGPGLGPGARWAWRASRTRPRPRRVRGLGSGSGWPARAGGCAGYGPASRLASAGCWP
jgi:hypothetical protein